MIQLLQVDLIRKEEKAELLMGKRWVHTKFMQYCSTTLPNPCTIEFPNKSRLFESKCSDMASHYEKYAHNWKTAEGRVLSEDLRSYFRFDIFGRSRQTAIMSEFGHLISHLKSLSTIFIAQSPLWVGRKKEIAKSSPGLRAAWRQTRRERSSSAASDSSCWVESYLFARSVPMVWTISSDTNSGDSE